MNYIVVLMRPDLTGLVQSFGPYETLGEVERALSELEAWRALRGQWEIHRLTHYKTGNAPNLPFPPSDPQPATVWPRTGYRPLGPVYCGAPEWGWPPSGAAGYVVPLSSVSTAAGANSEPAEPAPEAKDPTDPAGAPTACGPARAPWDADAHDYLVHAPENGAAHQPPLEVRAAYHVADGDFVHFKDNADETVLAVRVEEVGRIERLRTHMVLSASAEELDLIIGALFAYASAAGSRNQSHMADACARRLQKVQAAAHAHAAGDLSMPRT